MPFTHETAHAAVANMLPNVFPDSPVYQAALDVLLAPDLEKRVAGNAGQQRATSSLFERAYPLSPVETTAGGLTN